MGYIEPYCGAASVLLNKPRSRMEVINDVDPGITIILRMVRDEPEEFIQRLSAIPYKREVFERAKIKTDESIPWRWCADEMTYAVNEFILRRMSRGGLKEAFAWSDRLRGGKPGDVNAWETIIQMIPHISERLQGVHITNEPTTELLPLADQEDMLVYCDPPYLPKTRKAKKTYRFEMTEEQHKELAELLNGMTAQVLLSGNPSSLYDEWYEGWSVSKRDIANHSSQQKIKESRTEVLWYNYVNTNYQENHERSNRTLEEDGATSLV